MLKPRISTASMAVFLSLSITGARGSEYEIASPFAPGTTWIVTLGGFGGAEPSFPGANAYALAVRPIVDIYRAGDRTWLSLPTDALSFTLYSTGDFRFGAAGDYILNRSHRDDSALHGLSDINYTWEAGAFAEYYPLPFLRTRIELLQGVSGADGLVANLMADYIFSPDPVWLFTVGPRLYLANTQYQSAFFSISSAESGPSGLPAYNASGGFNSAGIGTTVRYNLNEQLSLRAFAEWDRLVDGAADSPIVKLRGSADQYQFGLGGAYRFSFSW
ncbi:MAG: MipA/OmpV family protein [Rhodomicrobium sp.]